MKKKSIILKSRLLFPDPGGAVLKKSIKEKLSRIKHCKLLIISGGLGFGKSTTASLILREFHENHTWYRVSIEETDLNVFVQYLLTGIQKNIPGFCKKQKIFQYLEWGPEAVGSYFVRQMEKKVLQEYFFVIDDWHLIDKNKSILEFIDFLLNHTGPNIHFILTTQTQTRLPVAKYLSTNDAIVIDEDDLKFAPGEAACFFEHLSGNKERTLFIKKACRKTDGWAAGLRLVAYCAGQKSTRDSEHLFHSIDSADKYFFNYIETEIFQQLPAFDRNFLMQTAVLTLLKSDICDRLLQIEFSARILESFEKQHLFTKAILDEGFIYHSIFKDFLIHKLEREFSRIQIKDLHNRAAKIMISTGQWKIALFHYRNASNKDGIHQLLIEFGEKMIYDGQQSLFLHYTNLLSAKVVAHCPHIQANIGCLHMFSGKVIQAKVNYENALALFKEKGDHYGRLKCQVAIAKFDFQIGNMKATKFQVQYLINQTSDYPELQLDTLLKLIFCTSYMGNFKEAEAAIDQAQNVLANLPPSDEQRVMADALTFNKLLWYQHKGEFLNARQLGENGSDFVRLKIAGFQQNAWTCYHMGHFDDGILSAEKGISFMADHHIDDAFFLAWSYVGLAVNLLGQDKIDKAFCALDKSHLFFKEQQYHWGSGFVCWISAMCYVKRNEFKMAEDHVQKGLKLIDGLGLRLLKAMLNILNIKILLMMHRIEQAGQEINRFEKQEHVDDLMASKFVNANFLAVSASLLILERKFSAGLKKMDDFVHICKIQQYDVNEILCYELFLMIKKANGRIQRSKSSDFISQYFLNRQNKVSSLRISFLSKFNVETKEYRIPEKSWNNKKARQLFQYLIVYRYKGFIPKDVLMELLWPDEHPEKSSKRFHVTLASLRRILQPDIKKGEPSVYIRRSKDQYSIDPGKNAGIDIEIFDALIKRDSENTDSLERLEALKKAATLYRGDFLAEQLYDEWTIQLREDYHEKLLTVLSRLISICESQNQLEKCVEYTRLYLENEKHDELYYQKLMKFYGQLGRKKMIIKTFESCKKNIENELDCALTDQTFALYAQLV